MKIIDVLAFFTIIAIMAMAIGWGVELPMSLKLVFLSVGTMAAIDFFDR